VVEGLGDVKKLLVGLVLRRFAPPSRVVVVLRVLYPMPC
jgi:hypothetical protein